MSERVTLARIGKEYSLGEGMLGLRVRLLGRTEETLEFTRPYIREGGSTTGWIVLVKNQWKACSSIGLIQTEEAPEERKEGTEIFIVGGTVCPVYVEGAHKEYCKLNNLWEAAK